MTQQLVSYFLAVYLIGSIPVGDLLARLFHRESVLKPGEWTTKDSGDVFRILGMKLGLLVTVLDILKGWLALSPLLVNLARPTPDQAVWVMCLGGVLAVFGHCHSIFLGFRGGKGLAPTAGVLFTILPVPAFVSFLFWAAISFWGLSVRPGAVSAAGVMPIASILYIYFIAPEKLDFLYVVAALSIFTMWEYRVNLLSYMGFGATTPPPPPNPASQPSESDPSASTGSK